MDRSKAEGWVHDLRAAFDAWIRETELEKRMTELLAFAYRQGSYRQGAQSQLPKSKPETHQQRHVELHAKLAELVADWILAEPGILESQEPVAKLMEWSRKQTQNPTGPFEPQEVWKGFTVEDEKAVKAMAADAEGDIVKTAIAEADAEEQQLARRCAACSAQNCRSRRVPEKSIDKAPEAPPKDQPARPLPEIATEMERINELVMKIKAEEGKAAENRFSRLETDVDRVAGKVNELEDELNDDVATLQKSVNDLKRSVEIVKKDVEILDSRRTSVARSWTRSTRL